MRHLESWYAELSESLGHVVTLADIRKAEREPCEVCGHYHLGNARGCQECSCIDSQPAR